MADEAEKKKVPDYAYGKYSNYQRIQTNKYNKENYKTITVRFRAYGDYCHEREMIQKAAEAAGMSTNAFCVDALAEKAYNTLVKYGKIEP